MRFATWNVNSLKVRLPQVLDWLQKHKPDALCLQETKLEDAKFPEQELRGVGYHAVYSGQKTYNGVAILSKVRATDAQASIPDFDDPQKRVLAVTIDGVRVICLYVPNGQSVESDKYRYKLDWCAAAARFLREELSRHANVAMLGDFNVAPDDRDVHDPALWAGQVLCTVPERAAFGEFLAAGMQDSFRLFEQPPATFSWWDYRMLAFPKNHGMRIDHVLLSAPLAARCTASRIDRNERKGEKPSDHAPVLVELMD